MKIRNILEARYAGNPKAAIDSIKAAIKNEEDFAEGEDDEEELERSWQLLSAYESIIKMIKSGKVRTPDDLSEIGDMIYIATGSGDTDLSDNTVRELAKFLSIR